MGTYNSFEDLEVYQDTLTFTVEIFDLLKKEVFRYEYALNEQIKKAVISISNNISEGFERETDRELVRFLYIAKGSAGEVRNLLNILQKIDYIEEKECEKLKNRCCSFQNN
ncbi:four helix bundle protein [Sinomicrobium sp. M5D2P9]